MFLCDLVKTLFFVGSGFVIPGFLLKIMLNCLFVKRLCSYLRKKFFLKLIIKNLKTVVFNSSYRWVEFHSKKFRNFLSLISQIVMTYWC